MGPRGHRSVGAAGLLLPLEAIRLPPRAEWRRDLSIPVLRVGEQLDL